MRIYARWVMAIAMFIAAPIWSGEVAAPTVAKILKILVSAGSEGKVASLDPEVSKELMKVGVPLDSNARIVWVIGDQDAAKFAKQGKLVVCSQVSSISQGASIAIVTEGGRPSIYVSPTNAANSHVPIPDAVLKIGKVVK